MKAERFESWEAAFDCCRERNAPAVVRVGDDIAKIYPSGTCKTIEAHRERRRFVAYWLDDPRIDMKYHATDRDRVAYLLRAARSRGDTIHRVHHTCGYNYQIGELAINQRHGYHDAAGVVEGVIA